MERNELSMVVVPGSFSSACFVFQHLQPLTPPRGKRGIPTGEGVHFLNSFYGI